MSPPRGPYADFQFGLWKSTNSVGNINTAKSLQKSRKQFVSRRKRSLTGGSRQLSGYTSIFIDLFKPETNIQVTMKIQMHIQAMTMITHNLYHQLNKILTTGQLLSMVKLVSRMGQLLRGIKLVSTMIILRIIQNTCKGRQAPDMNLR